MSPEPQRSDSDDLVFTIAFAISRSIWTPKKFGIDAATPLARDIVAQLRLSNWRIERLAPARAHSTHANPKSED